jgi:hypothetical protein
MAKRGRKTKYEPERVARILDLLRSGNTRGTSAVASGISQDTFANWCARYSDFSEQVKEAEQEAVTRYLGHIEQAAIKGSWQAAAWILERRHYQEWGRKDRVEVVRQVQQLATDAGIDEAKAVAAAQDILKELRSQSRA